MLPPLTLKLHLSFSLEGVQARQTPVRQSPTLQGRHPLPSNLLKQRRRCRRHYRYRLSLCPITVALHTAGWDRFWERLTLALDAFFALILSAYSFSCWSFALESYDFVERSLVVADRRTINGATHDIFQLFFIQYLICLDTLHQCLECRCNVPVETSSSTVLY